jgi:signal peptidase II
VLGVVALDQLSKLWAVRDLADGPITVIGDDIGFALTRNTGSAFSLFQAFTPLLAIVAIGVAVLLVRAVRRTRDPLMVIGLSLVLGGALGNLVDRLVRSPGFLKGAVVDFVHVGSFPTFNVADSAITVGAIIIVIWAVRTDLIEQRAGRG